MYSESVRGFFVFIMEPVRLSLLSLSLSLSRFHWSEIRLIGTGCSTVLQCDCEGRTIALQAWSWGWGEKRQSFYRPELHCVELCLAQCSLSLPLSLPLSLSHIYCSQHFSNEVALLVSWSERLGALLEGAAGRDASQPLSPDGQPALWGAGKLPRLVPGGCPRCADAVCLEWTSQLVACYGNVVCCCCSIVVTNMPLKWKTSSPAIWKFPVPVLKTSRSSPLSPAYM